MPFPLEDVLILHGVMGIEQKAMSTGSHVIAARVLFTGVQYCK
jgi:hypothetical protein